MLAPRGGRTDRRTARCRRGHELHAAPALGARAADSYLIRFGTEGRSEGPRLGYLCLQQQHVEVGDRLSVDAQELQFISQSVCQFSDLKLPGRKGRVKSRPGERHGAAVAPPAPAFPWQTRFGTARGPTAGDVPPWPCAPVTPSSKPPGDGVSVGQQDETSSVAAGGASKPQVLRGGPSLLPTAPSMAVALNQPRDSMGSICFAALALELPQSNAQGRKH